MARQVEELGAENAQLREAVRLLQGTHDTDVSPEVALRLLAHVDSPDARLTLVKGADHRFSDPANLALLAQTLETLEL